MAIKCYHCNSVFYNIKGFFYHFKLNHNNLHSFNCGEDQCLRVFSSFKSFKKHINSHYNKCNIENASQCNTEQARECNATCTNYSDLLAIPSRQIETTISELPDEQTLCDTAAEVDYCDNSNSIPNANIQNERSISQFFDCAPLCKDLIASSTVQNEKPISKLFDEKCFLQKIKEQVSADLKTFFSNLYSNSLVSRSSVQAIFTEVKNIVCNKIFGLIQTFITNFNEQLGDKLSTVLKFIEEIFADFSSEYKRLKLFENAGQYIPPLDMKLGNRDIYIKDKSHEITLESFPVLGKIIPLRKVFKAIFEKDGVFEATQKNCESIMSSKTFVNFIQGDLWKKKSSNYTGNGKTVFPLFLYFDDYQVGNPLGSHPDKNKLGAVYVTIPCFPQKIFSSLGSLFLFALFYTSDRKHYGNKAIFTKIISELNFLQTTGIELNLQNCRKHIYFKLGLILGDNLGLHSILGFTESFSANYSCRFCKVHKKDYITSIGVLENQLRTPESYKYDVVLNDISATGIKEECVWHILPDFHLTENFAVDIMHDLFEGVCIYDLSNLLHVLIYDLNLFSLDCLNNRLKSFNFGDEKSKPPLILLQNGKIKIKYSASEMLCFSRYFGLLVGDLIPLELEIWKVWIKLREIIDIVTSPAVNFAECKILNIVIEEYLLLVVKYFKYLKPKHHHLLHYPLVLSKSGPLIKFWSMSFEQKHRESKLTSNISGSFKNMIHTLALKSQLKLCYFLISQQCTQMRYSEYMNIDDTVYSFFPNLAYKNELVSVNYVEIYGTIYKSNSVVVVDAHDLPSFLIIDKIFIFHEEVFFLGETVETIGFNRHYYAFEVKTKKEKRLISHSNLHDFIVCLKVKKNSKQFIAVRHIL